MKKRAQTEIMGLIVVVILISLVLLLVVKFKLSAIPSEIKEKFIETRLASNTLHTLLQTTTDCNEVTVQELLKDCAKYSSSDVFSFYCVIGDETKDPCAFVDEFISARFDETLKEWGDRAFEFSVASIRITNGDCSSEDITSITAANQPIPLGYETIVAKLEICS